MTDLVSDNQNAIQSPKRKFSFRFPNMGHNGEKDTSGISGTGGSTSSSGFHKEKKKFCEELSNIADLHVSSTLYIFFTFQFTNNKYLNPFSYPLF